MAAATSEINDNNSKEEAEEALKPVVDASDSDSSDSVDSDDSNEGEEDESIARLMAAIELEKEKKREREAALEKEKKEREAALKQKKKSSKKKSSKKKSSKKEKESERLKEQRAALKEQLKKLKEEGERLKRTEEESDSDSSDESSECSTPPSSESSDSSDSGAGTQNRSSRKSRRNKGKGKKGKKGSKKNVEAKLDELLAREYEQLKKEKKDKKQRIAEKLLELEKLKEARTKEDSKFSKAFKKANDDRSRLLKLEQKEKEDAEKLKMELDKLEKENARKMDETIMTAAYTRELTFMLDKERSMKFSMVKRKEEISQLLRLMKKAQIVDVCFLVDATGSMSRYIAEVRDKIKNLATELSVKHKDLRLNLAFVAYRDHCDAGTSYGQFSIFPFTSSLDDFKRFVGTVKAGGGGDGPEDIFGGYKKVTELNWQAPTTRVLIHVADAPCHGTRFHSMSDDYPAGDPNGLTAEDLLKRLRVDCNIFTYMFCRINNYTDKMIEEFHLILDQNKDWLKVLPMTSMNIFMDSVSKTISSSIIDVETKTVSSYMSEGKTAKREFTLDPRKPTDWSDISVKEFECNFYVMPELRSPDPTSIFKTIQGRFEMQTSRGCVQIAPNPFAKGALRVVYHARERGSSELDMRSCVIKDYIAVDVKGNAQEKHTSEMETQVVASFLASCFNKVKPRGAKDMSYLRTETINVEGMGFLTKEQYLDGSYQKFNNNWGWVDEETFSASIQAFSHWTYDVTVGYLIVVDLQGKKNESTVVLTDPVIHCKNLDRFGRTNLGGKGISKFFRTHACNKVCIKMGLKTHREQPLYKGVPASGTVLLE